MNARAPQPGFSRFMRRMRARISGDTAGRPGWPRRTFQVQKVRNALRCQAVTVSGWKIFKENAINYTRWVGWFPTLSGDPSLSPAVWS